MNRRKFIGIAAGTIVATGTTYYLFSDKSNFASGHNTQSWFVKYLEPFHLDYWK